MDEIPGDLLQSDFGASGPARIGLSGERAGIQAEVALPTRPLHKGAEQVRPIFLWTNAHRQIKREIIPSRQRWCDALVFPTPQREEDASGRIHNYDPKP